jgi:predicted transcriptional regulator
LKRSVDIEAHNVHYHLDELVDVGLVDKRQRRTADSQGFYTYYRPTPMGRGILDHGVEELMRRERAFNEAYD